MGECCKGVNCVQGAITNGRRPLFHRIREFAGAGPALRLSLTASRRWLSFGRNRAPNGGWQYCCPIIRARRVAPVMP